MFKQPSTPAASALALFDTRQLRSNVERQESFRVVHGIFYTAGTAGLQMLMGHLPVTGLAAAAATAAQIRFIEQGRRYAHQGPAQRELHNNLLTTSNNIIMGGVSAAVQATALVETTTDMARITLAHQAHGNKHASILTGAFGVMAAMGAAACVHRMYKVRQGLHRVRALRNTAASRDGCT